MFLRHSRFSSLRQDRGYSLLRIVLGGLTACLLVAAVALSTAPAPQAQPLSGQPADQGPAHLERQVVQVGPGRALKTLGEAARRARDGMTIEVDAGDYIADTAVWRHNDLRVRAVGGRVRLVANGASAEGKGIWVVRAARMSVEGFDFSGAAVPSRNGAGIRFDSGSLHVRDCSFIGNQMGILTGNDPDAELHIENSEFAHNQRPDGHNHNLYVGTIARLSVTASHFHHAHVGHLLKSRAAVNHIRYNRLTDEDGRASYELEFPNGGVAHVVGNIIQQGIRTENVHMISFGAEGYRWPVNALYLVNNTLIDELPAKGIALRVMPGADEVRVINNVLLGSADWSRGAVVDLRNNFKLGPGDLADPAAGDFRLSRASSAWAKAVDPGDVNGVPLGPAREYRHPRHTVPLQAPPMQPGAMQSVAPMPGS